jgi:hypothetical protein
VKDIDPSEAAHQVTPRKDYRGTILRSFRATRTRCRQAIDYHTKQRQALEQRPRSASGAAETENPGRDFSWVEALNATGSEPF